MIRVRIDGLTDGMRLARTVYADDGRVLLSRGMRLNRHFIERLTARGVPAVYVVDERVGMTPVEDAVDDETRQQVTDQIRKSFVQAGRNGLVNVRQITRSVDNLLEQIIANPQVVYSLTDIRSADTYTFVHSVNVTILSLMLGLGLGLNPQELRELGVGAVLHDIGKVRIPDAILNKEGPLTDDEMKEIRRHPRYGYDILRQSERLSLLSAHVAYQHHERMNGTGYPRRLAGETIHPYARIVMVADVFDAMTADRIYRPGMAPHVAVDVIRRQSDSAFEKPVVDHFLAAVAPYPVGSLVELDTKEVAVVVKVRRSDPARPVVRLLRDERGAPIQNFAEVDLEKERQRRVVRYLGG